MKIKIKTKKRNPLVAVVMTKKGAGRHKNKKKEQMYEERFDPRNYSE